jgi:hypothetical protein
MSGAHPHHPQTKTRLEPHWGVIRGILDIRLSSTYALGGTCRKLIVVDEDSSPTEMVPRLRRRQHNDESVLESGDTCRSDQRELMAAKQLGDSGGQTVPAKPGMGDESMVDCVSRMTR